MIKHTTVALVLAAASSSAMAQQSILSFGFTDLNGSYTLLGSTFRALGSAGANGDVTRLQGPAGTAVYAAGTTLGRVDVSLTVSGILGGTANGNGTFTIFDADAVNPDSITGTVSGQFIQNGPVVFFNGLLSNVFLNDNGVLDGLFDGPTGGSFPLNFGPNTPPFSGALIELFVGSPANFFTGDFSGVSTQVSGQVVPAPTSLAVLGLGLIAAGRRRRR